MEMQRKMIVVRWCGQEGRETPVHLHVHSWEEFVSEAQDECAVQDFYLADKKIDRYDILRRNGRRFRHNYFLPLSGKWARVDDGIPITKKPIDNTIFCRPADPACWHPIGGMTAGGEYELPDGRRFVHRSVNHPTHPTNAKNVDSLEFIS